MTDQFHITSRESKGQELLNANFCCHRNFVTIAKGSSYLDHVDSGYITSFFDMLTL